MQQQCNKFQDTCLAKRLDRSSEAARNRETPQPTECGPHLRKALALRTLPATVLLQVERVCQSQAVVQD